MNNTFKTTSSRYGDSRTVTNNGHGWFTVEGNARYYRVGMSDDNEEIAYFDPEGGPFIAIGDQFHGHGIITKICVEKTTKGKFKIRVEVS